MKFKIGDRVYLSRYGDNPDNKCHLGTVIEYNPLIYGYYGKKTFPYVVRFDNGFTEVYRDEELSHARNGTKSRMGCDPT